MGIMKLDDSASPEQFARDVSKNAAPVKKTIAPLLTYSALIGAALHYVGYLYLRSYLAGAGFYQAHIDISIQEALFQGNEALTYIIFSIIEKFDWPSFLSQAAPSMAIPALFFTILYSAFLFFAKSGSTKKFNLRKARTRVIRFLFKPKTRFSKILRFPAVYAASFVSLLSISIITFLAIFSILCAAWMVLNVSQFVGLSAGNKKAFNHNCVELNLEDISEYKKTILGCQKIVLTEPFNDKKELVGIRIFTSRDTIFFLTNDGSYEISMDLNIMLFTSKHDIERLRKEALKESKKPYFLDNHNLRDSQKHKER